MANAAYWFKHDTNAKDDHKVMLLMDQLGIEGYGIFWILIEVLREQDNYVYPLSMLPVLAKRYYSSAEKFRAVVLNYGLFEVFEDDSFSSPSLLKRMDSYDAICGKRRVSGSIGGKKKAEKLIANAKQMLSNDVANAKQPCSKPVASRVELSRVEESGEDKKGEELPKGSVKRKAFTAPEKKETASFFTENGSTIEEAGRYWYHYDANGWMAGKVRMSNWKSAAMKWIANSKTIYRKNIDVTDSNQSGLTKADHAANAYKFAGGGNMGE